MDAARAWLDAHVVQRVRYVFTQNVTPEKLALSLACGLAGGLFPIPGVTTLVCFVFIALFHLNVAATQLVNVLATPISLALVVPHMALGNRLLGVDADLSEVPTLFAQGIFTALSAVGGHVARGVLAWALLSPLVIGASYALLLQITRRVLTKAD